MMRAPRVGILLLLSHSLFAQTAPATLHVDARPAHARTFIPNRALGTSIDILPQGVVDKVYTPEILKESLSAGWGPITYRQNTELQIEAWHWNPNGSWSDPVHHAGYFTGSATPHEFIRHSYGYPLPHRGNTRNGGTERGYSRLTDGDPNSYWKSNPYLSEKFSGEADSTHPAWVVIDLGAAELVSAMGIAWANPYARSYEVQYWSGATDPFINPTGGTWTLFPNGSISNSQGGMAELTLSRDPIRARYLRLWMTQSSNTCDSHGSGDPRNCAGFAINELYAGNYTNAGEFVDLVLHRPDQNQTATYVSSIDPWHSASDLAENHGDQTGFDLFYTTGITNHLPAMIPVAMLYGTPEDAASEIAYLEKRGYPIGYIEMGEEPDGQNMMPEDYGALYLQFADAIHQVDPKLKLGGPVFEGVNEDIKVWPDAQGRTSWLGRFLDYLKAHARMSDLAFMSFEHYPFDACDTTWSDLYREPQRVSHILQVWRDDGLPANVPMMITESNVASAQNAAMTDIFAALWLADSVGAFLDAGGDVYYHSPIQPEPLRNGCRGWGTYGNFVADQNLHLRAHTSQYFASQLINREWVQQGPDEHKLYPASVDLKDAAGHVLVTAYPVERPDGEWSIMAVNRDQSNPHAVRIVIEDGSSQKRFKGPVRVVSFGSEQYVWHSAGPNSYADPDGPAVVNTVQAGADTVFMLPKASVTVMQGSVAQ
ncbi:MAG TPA: discoidin domain-containing protein [Terriglobales bacterium]|nr:discoidin domain-containing protein [Terriglobales bacterium]